MNSEVGIVRWLAGLASPASKSRQAAPLLGPNGLRAFRLALAIVSIASLTYFSPFQRPYSVSELRVGSIAPERITAPLPFFVRKSDEELERERLLSERAVPTILIKDEETKGVRSAKLDSVLAVLIPNARMQMPDSLKQRRLQRELPDVSRSLSDAAVELLTQSLATSPMSAVEALREDCLQLLADLYSTGVISSKDDPLTRVTDQVRVGDSEFSIDSFFDASTLRVRGLKGLMGSYEAILASGSNGSDPGASRSVHHAKSHCGR